jgi:ribose 5-phosphate isomerase B
MKIAVAADHAGFEIKQWLADQLRVAGHEVVDLGTHTREPVDYPDFALALGHALLEGRAERGILICGSGVGASIAANKIKGIRAAVCHDTYSAHQGVEHDAMNVLCLGSRVIGKSLSLEIARAFLTAQQSREERHLRRVQKILEIERQNERGGPP